MIPYRLFERYLTVRILHVCGDDPTMPGLEIRLGVVFSTYVEMIPMYCYSIILEGWYSPRMWR